MPRWEFAELSAFSKEKSPAPRGFFENQQVSFSNVSQQVSPLLDASPCPIRIFPAEQVSSVVWCTQFFTLQAIHCRVLQSDIPIHSFPTVFGQA